MKNKIETELVTKFIVINKNQAILNSEIELKNCFNSYTQTYNELVKLLYAYPNLNNMIEIVMIEGEEEIISHKENYDSKSIPIKYLTNIREICGYRRSFSQLKIELNKT